MKQSVDSDSETAWVAKECGDISKLNARFGVIRDGADVVFKITGMLHVFTLSALIMRN